MVICKNCGFQLPDGTSYCANCGYKIAQVKGSMQGNGYKMQKPVEPVQRKKLQNGIHNPKPYDRSVNMRESQFNKVNNTTCLYCAYADKENGNPVWCRFHKAAVTKNNMCENFLSFLDAPVMSSLIERAAKKSQGEDVKVGIPVGNYFMDFLAWILIILIIIAGGLTFLYF